MHVINPFHLLIFVFLFGAVWFSSGALKAGVKHYAEVDTSTAAKMVSAVSLCACMHGVCLVLFVHAYKQFFSILTLKCL